MKLLPDVPVVIVFFHLAAPGILLGHEAVVQLRRFILQQQRRNLLPNTLWSHLLQVLLGLPK